jgi:hypothetical protein
MAVIDVIYDERVGVRPPQFGWVWTNAAAGD